MTPDDHLQRTKSEAVRSLCQWLEIPSISTQPEHADDVRHAAEWVSARLTRSGFDSAILTTPGHPVVVARHMDAGPGRPTVLVYGHLDMQPEGDLSRWTTPPFRPAVRDGRIYARGAADNKGQIFAQILGAEAWLHASGPGGKLPVNLVMLIEGEEEIGSPNLPGFLREHAADLACDIVVMSDTPVWKPGRPALSLGTRGNIGVEVIVTGPDRDLHSGMYGGSVANPIAVLARMIAALHDDDRRVTVPGYYDDVRPIPQVERDAWASLDHDDEAYARMVGCPVDGEAGFTTLERRWGRPTLEFNGITGGYQGPGSNTIVPSWASVKITGRLVPEQDPDRLTQALIDHLGALAPDTVRVEFRPRKMGARAYHIQPDHPALGAAADAFRSVYGVDPVLVREGLSLPVLPAFREALGADTVLLGYCHPDCHAHSFDEFFGVDELLLGARTSAAFLDRFARAGGRR